MKYRQQMLCPTDLKVEAYSALDLALTFLGKYKKDPSVNKMGGGTIQKGNDKFIFDIDILGKSPSDALISEYIVSKILLMLSSASCPAGFPKAQGTSSNTFKHGDLTIQYDFEDLNARVPLCKVFNNNSKNLVAALLDKISSSNSSVMNSVAKEEIKNFINNDKIFTKWPTVQYVASKAKSTIGSVTGKNLDIESLKKWFTIEPYIVEDISKLNKKFKINLLTAPKETLETITLTQNSSAASPTTVSIPTTEKFADYDTLIGQGGPLKDYCSNEVQFFALKVRVSNDLGNAYTIHCICDAVNRARGQPSNQRLPFNIIKIEEF
jgi:hypothetical protein